MGEQAVRAFLALPLSPENKAAVWKILRPRIERYGVFREIPCENWHLTLHFFGRLSHSEIEMLSRSLTPFFSGCQPLTIRIEGAGAFPSLSKARIVWVGVKEARGRLRTLSGRLNGLLSRLGFEPEARPFVPHITVARLKNSAAPVRIEQSDFPRFASEPETVDSVMLYRSILSSSGAEYMPLAGFPLGAGG